MIWWLLVATLLILSTAAGRMIGAVLVGLGLVGFVLYSVAYVVGCGLSAGLH